MSQISRMSRERHGDSYKRRIRLSTQPYIFVADSGDREAV
jgi:hypothetical protein